MLAKDEEGCDNSQTWVGQGLPNAPLKQCQRWSGHFPLRRLGAWPSFSAESAVAPRWQPHLKRADGVPNAEFPRAENLGHYPLAIIHHAFHESQANRVHLFTGVPRRINEQDYLTYLDLASK